MGSLTGSSNPISTVYKKLVFLDSNKLYTDSGTSDVELTTLASSITFSGTITLSSIASGDGSGENFLVEDSGVVKKRTAAQVRSDLGIADAEIIDWTSDQGDTNIHSGNYTDTNTNQLTEFTLTADTGSNQTIAHGNTLDIEGGTGIDTSVGATDKVTVALASGAALANLSGGSGTTFLRKDGTWATPTDTNTQLTDEQVQDIVGAMFTGNTETRISATYEDGDGTIDLVVDDMTADTNTQLSDEQVQDIVGAMFSSNTETNITATYQDADGTVDLEVSDAFLVNNADDTTTGTLTIHRDIDSTANHTTDGLYLNVDVDGIIGSGQTGNNKALYINLDSTSATQVGTVNNVGIDIDLIAGTSGVQSNEGVSITASGADKNRGLTINVPDGADDYHIKLIANDDSDSDYAMINVADTGVLTISTDGDGTTDSNLILDVDGDIELNADGGDIAFKDDSADLAALSSSGLTINNISEVGSDTDKFIMSDSGVLKYVTGANLRSYIGAGTSSFGGALNDLSDVTYSSGDLTISSLDKIIASDFVIDSGASVELDAHNGNFVAKKAGTEFSATNSAYAGMILGCTRIQNDGTASADNSIALSSTMAPMVTNQGTEVGITFKAPPSGNVEIIFTCYLYTNSTTIAFALSSTDSGTGFTEVDQTHTYDQGTYKMDETDINTVSISWMLTGLTSGSSYTYYIAGEEVFGSTSTINHGRFRLTGKHYPPITLKAIALPVSITTGE